ncbi:GNAT family N-acetyltransferase [Spongiactinospora rosea]|uniref:GNAT family N-acetyltransferase n=2 Tax=Spongiactinospora rosea TaxID=2248750 RepID=A0A366M629_9ACTN|nr:GNAT family N-acetyltransferase [Spongiactinospora rosea]
MGIRFGCMEMEIERAAAEDAPGIVGMRRAAEEWLAGQGIWQWPPGLLTSAQVEAQIATHEWYVARAGDGRLAGAFRLVWSDPRVWRERDAFAAYVHGLMADRAFAGAGVGARILSWVACRAREKGARMVRLDCVANNPRLRQYYVDLGFSEVGRQKLNERWTAVLLERRLGLGC